MLRQEFLALDVKVLEPESRPAFGFFCYQDNLCAAADAVCARFSQ